MFFCYISEIKIKPNFFLSLKLVASMTPSSPSSTLGIHLAYQCLYTKSKVFFKNLISLILIRGCTYIMSYWFWVGLGWDFGFLGLWPGTSLSTNGQAEEGWQGRLCGASEGPCQEAGAGPRCGWGGSGDNNWLRISLIQTHLQLNVGPVLHCLFCNDPFHSRHKKVDHMEVHHGQLWHYDVLFRCALVVLKSCHPRHMRRWGKQLLLITCHIMLCRCRMTACSSASSVGTHSKVRPPRPSIWRYIYNIAIISCLLFCPGLSRPSRLCLWFQIFPYQEGEDHTREHIWTVMSDLKNIFKYISLASILGYPVQEKGVFSSDDFLSDLSGCWMPLGRPIWVLRAPAQLRLFPQIVQLLGLPSLLNTLVRTFQCPSLFVCRILYVFSQYLLTLVIGFVISALSTDSAVVGLVVLVVYQVHS